MRGLFLFPLKPVATFAIIPLGTKLCLSNSILRVKFVKFGVYKIPGSDSLQNFGIPKEADSCQYAAANWGSPADGLQLSHSFRHKQLGNTCWSPPSGKPFLKQHAVKDYHNLSHCRTSRFALQGLWNGNGYSQAVQRGASNWQRAYSCVFPPSSCSTNNYFFPKTPSSRSFWSERRKKKQANS